MANIFVNLIMKWFLCISLVLFFSSYFHYFIIKVEARVHKVEPQSFELQYHTFEVTSLLRDGNEESCNSSPKGKRKRNSLEVRHKHGPCSTFEAIKGRQPSDIEILKLDEEQVNSIRERTRTKSVQVDTMHIDKVPKQRNTSIQEEVDLPVPVTRDTIESGNFVVTIGLGTPKKDLSLIFDTRSDLTWTQCGPCKVNCYSQKESKFDSSQSSSYSNISCTSTQCSELELTTITPPQCASGTSTCIYSYNYRDSSTFSIGFFAKDTLSLGSNTSIPDFYFGCGEYNQELLTGIDGILGLGTKQFSTTSQFASKYGKYFSYCLPSKYNSIGHLTFGKGGTVSKSIIYTPLLKNPEGPSSYLTTLQGLTVLGQKLTISPSVFSEGGIIIDSGTMITRLPPDAYVALEDAFNKAMSKYPKVPGVVVLDICYNFSNYTTITVPKIGFLFKDEVEVVLPVTGMFYVFSLSQVCLAFTPNTLPSDVGIIGNIQQHTFDIVYDVDGSKLGFGPGGCT